MRNYDDRDDVRPFSSTLMPSVLRYPPLDDPMRDMNPEPMRVYRERDPMEEMNPPPLRLLRDTHPEYPDPEPRWLDPLRGFEPPPEPLIFEQPQPYMMDVRPLSHDLLPGVPQQASPYAGYVAPTSYETYGPDRTIAYGTEAQCAFWGLNPAVYVPAQHQM